ncbi:hypothetical protein [Chryseobacterium sp. c4a]|uniref:hypothetical protein n=1 Tax=Chryseobacterium sp. c4a TaxID=1573582 RepID=UPI00135ABDC0|nr:hypothetical protein [Chryseobacterium sp. c4a]
MKSVAKQHKGFMRKKTILICTFISLFASCQKEDKKLNNTENKVIMNNEINILEEQLKKGLKATIGNAVDFQTQYNEEDLDIENQTLDKILKNNGYRQLSIDEFKKKVKLVFQRDLDYSSTKNYIYVNFFNPCNRESIYYQNNTIDYNGYFLFKNSGFIAPLYTIPEIIDYQKKFPEVIEFEKKLSNSYKNNKGEEITINKWMNEPNLLQKRNQNIQRITAQNKYLFNDSKADLVWLKFNDKMFLETLVKDFGYVKDKDLLEWYIKGNGIEKYSKDKETYLKVFYTKNCDNSFNIHSETFAYMDSDPEKYSKEIVSVLEDIRTDRVKLENLSFEQKSRLIAHLLYFGEKHKEKTGMTFSFMGTFYEHSQEDLQKKYDEEFKKQKYYGLPFFEKYWNDAKIEGDGIGLDM